MCGSPSCSSAIFTWNIAFESQLLNSKNCAKMSVLVMIQVFWSQNAFLLVNTYIKTVFRLSRAL